MKGRIRASGLSGRAGSRSLRDISEAGRGQEGAAGCGQRRPGKSRAAFPARAGGAAPLSSSWLTPAPVSRVIGCPPGVTSPVSSHQHGDSEVGFAASMTRSSG